LIVVLKRLIKLRFFIIEFIEHKIQKHVKNNILVT